MLENMRIVSGDRDTHSYTLRSHDGKSFDANLVRHGNGNNYLRIASKDDNQLIAMRPATNQSVHDLFARYNRDLQQAAAARPQAQPQRMLTSQQQAVPAAYSYSATPSQYAKGTSQQGLSTRYGPVRYSSYASQPAPAIASSSRSHASSQPRQILPGLTPSYTLPLVSNTASSSRTPAIEHPEIKKVISKMKSGELNLTDPNNPLETDGKGNKFCVCYYTLNRKISSQTEGFSDFLFSQNKVSKEIIQEKTEFSDIYSHQEKSVHAYVDSSGIITISDGHHRAYTALMNQKPLGIRLYITENDDSDDEMPKFKLKDIRLVEGFV